MKQKPDKSDKNKNHIAGSGKKAEKEKREHYRQSLPTKPVDTKYQKDKY